jgi:hypothetical protein
MGGGDILVRIRTRGEVEVEVEVYLTWDADRTAPVLRLLRLLFLHSLADLYLALLDMQTLERYVVSLIHYSVESISTAPTTGTPELVYSSFRTLAEWHRYTSERHEPVSQPYHADYEVCYTILLFDFDFYYEGRKGVEKKQAGDGADGSLLTA